MAHVNTRLLSTLFFLFLLAAASTAAAESPFSLRFFFSNSKSILSLSHSLLTRVANLRAERGDIAGSNRAKLIAQKLERATGLGFSGMAWSVGWDYLRNYAWRDLDYRELHGVVSQLNELLGFLGELTRAESDRERADWIVGNYQSILRVCKSVLRKLTKVFHASGPLKELVETVQREVVKGGLLMDCLELGSNDLKGVVQILRNLFNSESVSSSSYRTEL